MELSVFQAMEKELSEVKGKYQSLVKKLEIVQMQAKTVLEENV